MADIATQEQKAYDQKEKEGPGKRKSKDEGEFSAQRPRKITFRTPSRKQESAEEDDDEGHPDVPSPTSSPEQEASDGEDNDIFQGKYSSAKSQALVPKEAPTCRSDYETPPQRPSKRFEAGTRSPATDTIANHSEEVKGMLATLDDALLATIPSELSRPTPMVQIVVLCMFAAVAIPGIIFSLSLSLSLSLLLSLCVFLCSFSQGVLQLDSQSSLFLASALQQRSAARACRADRRGNPDLGGCTGSLSRRRLLLASTAVGSRVHWKTCYSFACLGLIPNSLGEIAKQTYEKLTLKGKKAFRTWPSKLSEDCALMFASLGQQLIVRGRNQDV